MKILVGVTLFSLVVLSSCQPATTPTPGLSPTQRITSPTTREPSTLPSTATHSETATPKAKSKELPTARPVKQGLNLLTKGVRADSATYVRWSPDSKRIVFSTSDVVISHKFKYYEVNPDGSELQLLLQIPFNASALQWSPDGKRILFCAYFNDSPSAGMYIISPDGTGLTGVTNKKIENLQGSFCNPIWSPDGNSIVFVAGEHENLYTVDADSQNLRALSTPNLTTVRNLQWAPDGSSLLFSAEDSAQGDKLGLYILKTKKGSRPILLREEPNYNGVSKWSPDGKKIFYLGDAGAYSMNADGTDQTQITNLPVEALTGSWSPDGSQIAYSSKLDGDYDIYIINSDGTNLRSFRDPDSDDMSPVWSPDGQSLLFSAHHHTEYGDLLVIAVKEMISR